MNEFDFKERYTRNKQALSAEEVEILHTKKVCVIGAGGLGGYIVEILARIGVLHITVVDYDVFEASNLNRQLFSSESVIGIPKVEVVVKRIADVNSQVKINGIKIKLNHSNCEEIIKGHDIVMDALDNIEARLLLTDCCKELGITLVHGSIGGWYGQVAGIFPGDKILSKVYQNTSEKGIENLLGNLPFSAAMVASLQCAECVKILIGRGEVLRNTMLRVDLLRGEFCRISL